MDFIYTCPKCGKDLQSVMLTTNPPQHQYKCYGCGWSHTTMPSEHQLRVPFPIDAIDKLNTGIGWSDVHIELATPPEYKYYNPKNLSADMSTDHVVAVGAVEVAV